MRKIINAYYAEKKHEWIGEKLSWRIENPRLAKVASLVEAVTNIPLARIVNKANNLEEAITGQHETWKRVAMVLGWNAWDLGIKDEEIEKAKKEVEVERKIEKEKKAKIEKEEKKKEKEEQKKKEEEKKKKE